MIKKNLGFSTAYFIWLVTTRKVGSTAACTQNLSTHASTYFHFFASIYAECKVAIPLRYAALFMVPWAFKKDIHLVTKCTFIPW